jgi:hypothetical protein
MVLLTQFGAWRPVRGWEKSKLIVISSVLALKVVFHIALIFFFSSHFDSKFLILIMLQHGSCVLFGLEMALD